MTVTGTMSELNRKGDTKTLWDKDNPDEVAIAKRTFEDFKRKGYLAYTVVGKKGDKGEIIREFDPELERIIFVRANVGG